MRVDEAPESGSVAAPGDQLSDAAVEARLRAAVRDGEARLAGIVDSAMDAIITVDGEQRIVLFNKAAETMFGCMAADAVGSPLERFIPTRYRAEHGGQIERFGHSSVSRRAMGRLAPVTALRTDGSEFPVEVSISQIELGGGKLFTAILRDVSLLRQAESELRRSRAQLQGIFDNLGEGVIVSTLTGELLDCNAAGLKMHGFASRDECPGHFARLAELFQLSTLDGALLPCEQWPLARILRGEVLRQVELRLKRLDKGWQRFFSYSGALVRDRDGKPLMALLSVSDIHVRKRVEQSLRASEARFRSYTENAPTAIFVADGNGHYLDFNAAAERLLGYEWAELARMSISDVVAEIDRAAALENFRQVVETGRSEGEFRLRRRDGGLVWVELRAVRIATDRYMAYCVDIGERKAAEVATRQALEASERANLAKTTFLANMSHELRTPMHAILAFAAIGQRKSLTAAPEKLQDLFEKIQHSGQRMIGLLDDLLDLAKLEAGLMSFRRERVELIALIESHVNELHSLIEAKSLRVEISAAADLPAVQADPIRLGQVVTNILANAIRFSPPRGWIGIDLASTGTAVRMLVTDQGCGIPPDELESIFDKFVQSSRTSTGAGGTGLGLSICREIVNQHQGRIAAFNTPEGGAAFEVLIPLAAGA